MTATTSERLPAYGDPTVAHASLRSEGWVVWFRHQGCVVTGASIGLARRLVRSMGVEWKHYDGPEVTE